MFARLRLREGVSGAARPGEDVGDTTESWARVLQRSQQRFDGTGDIERE